jgi:hypothetical protein
MDHRTPDGSPRRDRSAHFALRLRRAAHIIAAIPVTTRSEIMTMKRMLPIPLLALCLLGWLSCSSDVESPLIGVGHDEVASSTVVPGIDTSRTYMYNAPSVNADSILALLIKDGIPVEYGWEAIDYLCADPMGPRFTVELHHDDARITAYGFVRGVGRLACATRLKRYTVTRAA